MSVRLSEIAQAVKGRVVGDETAIVDGLAPLDQAQANHVSFLANSRYRKHLSHSQAGAVILTDSDYSDCPTNAIIVDDPYLAFAKTACLFENKVESWQGVHETAVIQPGAQVDASAVVGPQTVIESGAVVAANVRIGPACVVGRDVEVGAGTELIARVALCHGVKLGERVIVHPGAVIGSDGFGLANDQGTWLKIPQLGTVIIGHDVEIGANTTIDRGAIGNTVIEEGVKLDNQIQIGHNVRIGAHTAIAGCVGIAGSSKIGRHCMIAGGVGIVGHVDICDKVIVTGMTLVSKSITEPGTYSSGVPMTPHSQWRKNMARFRHLDELSRRLTKLERKPASS